MKSDKYNNEECNDICKDCLKWKQFGKNCWVYWEGKKYCTMKVTSEEEWKKEMLFLK